MHLYGQKKAGDCLSFINATYGTHLLELVLVVNEYRKQTILACNFQLLVTFCDDNKRNMKWSTSTMPNGEWRTCGCCSALAVQIWRQKSIRKRFKTSLVPGPRTASPRRRCPPEEEMPIWHAQRELQPGCEWLGRWVVGRAGLALRIVLPKREWPAKTLTSYRRADADGWVQARTPLDQATGPKDKRRRRRQRQMRLVGSEISEIITIFIINCGKSGALAL